jgi:hypothetical protein
MRASTLRRLLAIAATCLVLGAPVAMAMPVLADTATPADVQPGNEGFGHQKCKPHPGEGRNPHCPPPVIPEAPLAVMLPVSAGAIFGVAYLVMRRRGVLEAAP